MKRSVVALAAVLAAATLTVAAAPAYADTPLSTPTNLQALHVADTSADLDWLHDGMSSQDVIERMVGSSWQEYTRTSGAFLTLTGLTPGATYTFRIYSIPFAGLGYTTSARSAPVTFTTLSAPDSVPPTAPPAPVFSSVTTTRADVYWGEATDNVQVTGYYLQQLIGGAWTTIRTVAAASRFQTVTGLSAATSYSFAAIAFDARGNQSPRSATGTVTTLAITANLTCRVQVITYAPGFTVNVTIINTTAAPVSGWSVRFTAPLTMTVASTFGGTVTRDGTAGTLVPAVYYATIAPGSQPTLGFTGNSTGTFTPPSGFTVGGVPCTLS